MRGCTCTFDVLCPRWFFAPTWLWLPSVERPSCPVHVCRRWLDRSKRDVLRMILAEIAEAKGDHLDALALLRCVTDRWPTSVPCWNMYSRSVS